MIRIFKREQSIAAGIILVMLAFVTQYHFIFVASPLHFQANEGFLLSLLPRQITSISPTLIWLLYVGCILTQALLFNHIVSTHAGMFYKVGLLPAMTYVLLLGLLSEWYVLSAALFINFLVLALLYYLSVLYNSKKPFSVLFNIGMLLSIAYFCYKPSMILVLVTYICIINIRGLRMKDFFVCFLGILAPIYILLGTLYLFNKLVLVKNLYPSFQLHLPIIILKTKHWVSLGLIGFLIIYGLLKFNADRYRVTTQYRKYWGINNIFLVLLAIPMFFYHQATLEVGVFCVPFIAAICTIVFISKKKSALWANFLLLIILIAIGYNNWLFITHK